MSEAASESPEKSKFRSPSGVSVPKYSSNLSFECAFRSIFFGIQKPGCSGNAPENRRTGWSAYPPVFRFFFLIFPTSALETETMYSFVSFRRCSIFSSFVRFPFPGRRERRSDSNTFLSGTQPTRRPLRTISEKESAVISGERESEPHHLERVFLKFSTSLGKYTGSTLFPSTSPSAVAMERISASFSDTKGIFWDFPSSNSFVRHRAT